MHLSDLIRFYSNDKVKSKLLSLARGREIVTRFNEHVGKRPDSLIYENDIVELAKNRATSFHASMERWKNPLLLRSDMKKQELDALRIGWDLIIDVDCPHVEYSKICANLLCEALEFHGVKHYSVKFSGGSGFHIGVPFESFPKEINGEETRLLFPEAAKIITNYLGEMIKKQLADELIEFEDIKKITKRTGKTFSEIVKKGELDPYAIIKLDNAALSSRHLMRMPYSFNEKTWKVSFPMEKKDILSFKISDAEYKNIKVDLGFLDKFKKDEAKQLFVQAFDWEIRQNVSKELHELGEKFEVPTKAIDKNFFPPCVLKIYKGLEEGRKRALFILINFLKSAGWDDDSVKKEVLEWNKKNPEPLRESYINSQLTWHRRVKGAYLPPGCKNPSYYTDLKICEPDSFCSGIKNPIVYPFKKMKRAGKNGRRNIL